MTSPQEMINKLRDMGQNYACVGNAIDISQDRIGHIMFQAYILIRSYTSQYVLGVAHDRIPLRRVTYQEK